MVAVHRAARRREHDAAHAPGPRPLEEIEQPEDVDLRVEHRIRDRAAHVHLRGMMVEDREPPTRHHVTRLRRTHVGLRQLHAGGQILASAGGQIVQDDHLVARR